MTPSLLLVAHGSADPAASASVLAVLERLRSLQPGIACAAGFLERAEPSAAAALADLPRPVVAVPYLLAAAFHAKVDVARLGADAVADVLGDEPALVAVARDLLAARTGPVVLASAGTTDESANATTRAFAARLESALARPVVAAFATAAEPTVAAALSPGCTVLRWLLSPGHFADRIAADAAGHEVTAVIGDHPVLADVLLRRYAAAAAKMS